MQLIDVLVRLTQQTLQAQQHTLYIVNCAPLLLEDVQADASGEVDVGMVDRSLEQHGGRSVRIVGREYEAQLEVQARVGCFGGSGNRGSPGEHVAVVRKGGDAGSRGKHHCHQLRLQSK